MIPDTDERVDAAIGRALDAYTALTDLGAEIDDEWSYVDDLSTAWRARLVATATSRAGEPIDRAVAQAIDTVAAEAGRISDRHRAIDWLSTFPQVVLVALGERP